MKVDPVPMADPPFMDPDKALAPMRFAGVEFKLRRGRRIGSFRDGLECSEGGEQIYWNQGRLFTQDIEWSDLFFEQMNASGYAVVGDPSDLFPGHVRGERRAAYFVRAQIEEVRLNLCEVVDVLTRTPEDVQTGAGSVRVYWQVLSPLERRIAFEARSAGYHRIDRPIPDAVPVLLREAFAQAVANLAAEEDLLALVAAPRPTVADTVRRRRGEMVWLPYVPQFAEALPNHVEKVRRSVVTVDNGNGHGSGFFVARDLVLTNWHVVDGVETVRVVLPSGRDALGDVIRFDDRVDVALIKLEPTGHVPLPVRTLAIGAADDVFAVGAPLHQSLRATITKGVISRFSEDRFGHPRIQADVTVHAGNSGGPLLDAYGNVVGITVSGYRAGPDSPAGINLNFFIPIGHALEALNLRVRDRNDTRGAITGDGEDAPDDSAF